jgi:hypothetical protein
MTAAAAALASPAAIPSPSIEGGEGGFAAESLDLRPVALPDEPEAAPTWSEALARPIFSPDRRPFVPAPPEPRQAEPETVETAEPPPDAGLAVKGIFLHDNVRRALVTSAASPGGEWLTVGAAVAGWTVSAIEATSVVLSAPPAALTLQLNVDKETAN